MRREFRQCSDCKGHYLDTHPDTKQYVCPYCHSTDSKVAFIEEDELNADYKKEMADRFNNGKPQWSMVDFKSLEDMVRVLEFGEKKYSRDNWKKGLKTTEVVDSLLRHIYAYLNGEDIDPESGINHTGHIMCNAMFLSHMHLFRKDMDTRGE